MPTRDLTAVQAPYVRLLGRPRIETAGGSHAWPPERPYRVLSVLALRRGWVGRDELAALFWPAAAEGRPAANVRKALHLARGLAWLDGLEVQGGAVRWRVATDIDDFDRAARDGRCLDALDIAAAGELLDGMDEPALDAWTEWLAGERAALRRRVRAMATSRLAVLVDAPADAAQLARRLLDDDPLDEDAAVALLSALRILGRDDEQRAAYRAYALRLDEELGVEPSHRVRRLLPDAAQAAPAAGAGPPAEAVAASGGLIGREPALDELTTLLASDGCRVLTLSGPGGVGKSSLAKQALRSLQRRFADGAYWIALDDLQDPAQVAARLAIELRLPSAGPQPPLPRVAEHLAEREVLLVFDNAEHLTELPRLVERLIERAPRLRVCATSRARLGIRGERLLPLAGLECSPRDVSDEAVLASAAARLFTSAARSVQADFDPAPQAQAIGALARATGGLPLAILLAANWVRLLPVAEIDAELARSLDVLESADEGEERPEHRSVRATFERSWQLLTAREQRALAVLSVFAGGFSREAAHDVAGASLPLLAALADKSLLQLESGGRCSLHPLIRQFAGETLDADARADAQAGHAHHFHRRLAQLTVAAQAADQAALDEIGADLENCRQAWRWAIAQRDAAAIAGSAMALKEYFNTRGRVAEGLELLHQARALADDSAPACAAILLSALAQTHYRLSQLDEAAASARQGLRLARRAGHRGALVRCASVLGTCCWQWGRHQEAQRLLQQAERLARAGGDRRGAALAVHNLSLVEKALGHHARAAELMREWIAEQREQGEWLRLAMGLSNLAYVHQAQGEWSLAQASLEEGLALCDAHDLPMPRPALLANLAHNHAMRGRLDDAERVCAQLLDEARLKALADVEATALNQLVRVAILRGDLALARSRLAAATARATALGIEYVALDCVLSYARILCGEGRAAEAAPLLHQLLARSDLEPVDRADAQSCLHALPQALQDAAAPAQVPIEPLLRHIATELAAAGPAS
jgi:predicted ATPase/DNA-binding SARP family transcriptional activator